MVTKLRKKCRIKKCEKESFCKGLCKACYMKLWRNGRNYKLAFIPKNKTNSKKKNKLEVEISYVEHTLERIKMAYRNCAGFRSAIKLRQEMNELQIKIFNLKELLNFKEFKK